MNYKKYQKSRNCAWQILIDMKISSLPVRVTAICDELGIPVKVTEFEDDRDGQSTIVNGQPIILINSKVKNTGRIRFTLAHELGHVLLGHVGTYEYVNRASSSNYDSIEREANMFAARLLAPACVLWGCKVKSAEEIMRLCDISHQASEYRMNRMKELYNRNKFLTSPLERKVYRRFKKFISSYLHREDC